MSRILLNARVFTVEARVFERPGQPPVHREVVVHPGAVVVLPRFDERRIVMIRNHRYAVSEELWELPAGTLEPDETPVQTAARELEEEAGYRAERLEPLGEFYTSPGICTERMHAFVATGLTAVGQRLQGAERITPVVVELSEARRMLLAGQLRDGKTIAVLAWFLLGGVAPAGDQR
jgi:ADP-ribose pyrophosphatase